MSTELLTRDGRASKGSRNVDVALLQGRITPEQADEFRDLYATKDYEVVTQALLAHEPKLAHKPTRQVAPAKSFSERAIDDYLRRTVPPWQLP